MHVSRQKWLLPAAAGCCSGFDDDNGCRVAERPRELWRTKESRQRHGMVDLWS